MTLTVPAPFDTVVPYASIRGCRSINWTFTTPGQLCRNSYDSAWVAVAEVHAMRGEPLRIECQRRFEQRGRWDRDRFTDTARKRLHALLVPVVARYGFHRAWTELHLGGLDRNADHADKTADEYRDRAAWYTAQADLTRMLADGTAELRPLCDPIEVKVPRQGGSAWAGVWEHRSSHAEIVVDGVRLGWMVDDGTIAPEVDR